MSLKFRENGNFNYFAKNIFANDPRGQHKWCGMEKFSRNLISQLSKIHKICEKTTQKFSSIWYIKIIWRKQKGDTKRWRKHKRLKSGGNRQRHEGTRKERGSEEGRKEGREGKRREKVNKHTQPRGLLIVIPGSTV